VERIAALAPSGSGALVVTLGVEMVMAAQRDAAFRALINTSALSVCDTIGVLLAARIRGARLRERVTGVELVAALAARSVSDPSVRLFLLGGAEGTAARAAAALAVRFPGARIAGTRSGYFSEAENPAVVQLIGESRASVLLAGLGSPKQEKWIAGFAASAGCGVGIGVGGSFDVLAGDMQRAPQVIQRAGLEWAYRLVREPSRWRRQLALPRFALAQTAELLRLTMGKRSN
jgi:N-acetylglucosaminyldiphosphoundecaprenol N-acetyl-beta-D-mannosaminyltransferase